MATEIDLRPSNLDRAAAASVGTLVYVGVSADQPGSTALVRELEQRLHARGLVLRNLGGYFLEVAHARRPMPERQRGACLFCLGDVWCGRCRRCGTPA